MPVYKSSSWSDVPDLFCSRWEQRVDRYSRIYYVDHNTRTTAWEIPLPPGYDSLLSILQSCIDYIIWRIKPQFLCFYYVVMNRTDHFALGQNIEKNVDKKNSIECVKFIRKQAIILCFSARQNVPQKPRKLNMRNWVNYRLRRTKGKQIKKSFYSCTIVANIKQTNGK